MKLLQLLPLLLALCAPLTARAASPTFSSFDTNQFTITVGPSPQNLSTIHISSTGSFTNINLYVTNLYVTNIVINGFGLTIAYTDPVDPPPSANWLWINLSTSGIWAWDATQSAWVNVNPSFNTGLYAVPSIVELRMIADNGYLQWATTEGNLAPGDGQGRHYFWNASDTSADDGISVIKPDGTDAGAPGRWNEQ